MIGPGLLPRQRTRWASPFSGELQPRCSVQFVLWCAGKIARFNSCFGAQVGLQCSSRYEHGNAPTLSCSTILSPTAHESQPPPPVPNKHTSLISSNDAHLPSIAPRRVQRVTLAPHQRTKQIKNECIPHLFTERIRQKKITACSRLSHSNLPLLSACSPILNTPIALSVPSSAAQPSGYLRVAPL